MMPTNPRQPIPDQTTVVVNQQPPVQVINTGSPKTTVTGVLSLIAGGSALVYQIHTGSLDTQQLLTSVSSIVAGLGLIFARDHK